MTEPLDPMDPRTAYEAADQAIRAGDSGRLMELAAAAPFLITNHRLEEDEDALLVRAVNYSPRGILGLRLVETILDLGADVDFCPPWGFTALFEAADNQDVAMVGLLIKRGANPNILELPEDEGPPDYVLDIVELEIALQENRHAEMGEPDRDPGGVMPLIRDMLKQAGAKGYYELHPEELGQHTH